MRLIAKDLQEGRLVVKLDSLDDLWTLRNLIQDGDLVTAYTFRTAEAAGDKVRAEKMEKRPMRLGVRAHSVEWHDFDDHLRVLGPIETGPQDHGRHHTLVIRPDGAEVEVQKRRPLAQWELDEIQRAQQSSQAPQILLLAIDDSEAQFAHLKPHGLQVLGTLPSAGQGKRHPGALEAKRAFYDEACRSLAMLRPDPKVPLLVVGPGWWREEFLDHARQRAPALVHNSATDGTSQGGRAGLQEAVRRGLVDRLVQGHRVAAETLLVDELLGHIAKDDGLATYGPAQVAAAVASGAVQALLLADTHARQGTHDAIIQQAEAARTRIHVLSSAHEAGERLSQLGGIAALLRYRLEA